MRFNYNTKNSIIALIIIISFTLFAWGFSYNILKRLGFNEDISQIFGILLSFFFIILFEGITRFRLKKTLNM